MILPKMRRIVQPEILDNLSSSDPRAIRARRDLRLINTLMNHARLMRSAMIPILEKRAPVRVAEIGSGDGSLAGKIWRKWGSVSNGSRIDFVDRAGSLSPTIRTELEQFGWTVTEYPYDVMQWLIKVETDYDACYSSLFLHHFHEGELRQLLGHLSKCVRRFVCAEPRRNQWGLLGAAGLRLLGCDTITLNDSKISVLAGFQGNELSRLWSSNIASGWQLTERRAGCFSHYFTAVRLGVYVQ